MSALSFDTLQIHAGGLKLADNLLSLFERHTALNNEHRAQWEFFREITQIHIHSIKRCATYGNLSRYCCYQIFDIAHLFGILFSIIVTKGLRQRAGFDKQLNLADNP